MKGMKMSQVHVNTLTSPDKQPTIHSEGFDGYTSLRTAKEQHLRLITAVRDTVEETRRLATSLPPEVPEADDETRNLNRYLSPAVTIIKNRFNLHRPSEVIAGFEQAFEQEQQRAELELKYATNCYLVKTLAEDRQRTIVVIATKGGSGKTPLITNLAVLYAWITGDPTLFLEANENMGTAHLRLNIHRGGRLLLPGAIQNHSLISEPKLALKHLGKHFQTSLYALLSDPDEGRNRFTLGAFLSMYKVLRVKFGSAFGDTGNGFKAANEGMFLEGDDALFTAIADDAATFTTLIDTMVYLYTLGHKTKLQKHSFVVVNGTREHDTVDGFLKRIRDIAVEITTPQINPETGKMESSVWTEDPDQLLRDLGFAYDESGTRMTGEKLFMIPYSQWIKDGKPASILPEDTGLETLDAYAQVLIACLSQEVQPEIEKQSEIQRRLKDRNEPHDEEVGEPRITKPGIEAFAKALPSMTEEEIDTYIRLAADEAVRKQELKTD